MDQMWGTLKKEGGMMYKPILVMIDGRKHWIRCGTHWEGERKDEYTSRREVWYPISNIREGDRRRRRRMCLTSSVKCYKHSVYSALAIPWVGVLFATNVN